MNWKLAASLVAAFIAAANAELPPAHVPGVVIDYIPASTGTYIGSPSIAILPNGDYVASHDHFGPKTKEHECALTAVFRSADRGKTWKKVSEINGAFWSSLFVHRGALYLLGPNRHHGNILIRRSTDGGGTWTTPTNNTNGLLRDNGEYHCAPMPVIEHAGRLWRAFEWRHPPVAWGINYRAAMLSAPVDADLLNASSWTLAEPLPSDRAWNGGDMGAWLEGNAVVAPDGGIVDILRVQTTSPDEKAAIVHVSADGKKTSFDPATGFVNFPGGAKKFAIRFDPQGKLYWSLANIIPECHRANNAGGIRNTLALTCSPDLTNWTVRCIVLYHPDTAVHGFQYVDWLFDGNDIIVASRTAYDDGRGGAHNFHDANYLTFHRIAGFRRLTMADSVPFTEMPPARAETQEFIITGHSWKPAALADGEPAFANRTYVWKNVPEKFRGWRVTQTSGGEHAELRVKAKRDTSLFIATTLAQKAVQLGGWSEVAGAAFCYTDKAQTPMRVFSRALKAGVEITVPQGNWTGTLALLPPDAASTRAQPGLVRGEFIFESAPFPSCHASTIVETRGGALLAAWFGGTREGNPDVGIWLSRCEAGKWSVPVEVANGVEPDGKRFPCFNPVLFQFPGGPLTLFYKVGGHPKGWWGYRKTSTDDGATWSKAERLPDPFIGPVKNKPVALADGAILCGSSTENDGWRAHFERSADGGRTWQFIGPVNDGKEIAAIQPSILFHPGGKLQAIGRTQQGRLFEIWSGDGGKSWGPMTLTDLPNPNSGTDAVTLRDGRHLLVYNHTGLLPGKKSGLRSPLNVAVSADGKLWQAALVLEDEPRKEFSYPAVIQTRDGLVHIVYSWKREHIKHVVVDPAKLELKPIEK